MPSRPPHLPHPRSRSLDTALDKATGAAPVAADSMPQCSSVAGSLAGSLTGSVTGSFTDSTIPDSVPASITDSVAEVTLPSDTDASDSGISNKCSSKLNAESRRDSKGKDSSNTKHSAAIRAKESNSKNSFRRAHGSSTGSKEDIRLSGRLKNRSGKHTSSVSSDKGRLTPDFKATPKSSLPKEDDSRRALKMKPQTQDSPTALKFDSCKSLSKNQEKEDNTKDNNPYANFLKKRVNSKSKFLESDEKKHLSCRDGRILATSILASVPAGSKKEYSEPRNPYIVPKLSNICRKERSPQPSCSSNSSSPVPSSFTSGLRSPSLISSSSSTSLPQRRKDSVFSFPAKSESSFDNNKQTESLLSSQPHSFIPNTADSRNSLSPRAPHRTHTLENPPKPITFPKPKETSSSPFEALSVKPVTKRVKEIDLHKEGSHIDLVASCEQYLEDERKTASEDESTLASTRRSSISSIGSSNGRRRRRLSSIPLDDELTITEEDNFSTDISRQSPTKSASDTSHEMALFATIAALTHNDWSTDRTDDADSCGEYEGCSPSATKANQNLISTPQSATNPTPGATTKPNSVVPAVSPSSPNRSSGHSPSVKAATMQRSSSSDSSSLLDRYVNKVKTFIKK
ncbi:dentin sialophosphoprotein-like [Hyalella azteca]|uniref:Dentin sialophosphoprotein-like n=1 Tax=Hyalella azteca TaxID=294128 RepID=A0A8B7P5T8_HYAAZ|nr:dentin sialophosphoprotein-like [Hyalella azteca]